MMVFIESFVENLTLVIALCFAAGYLIAFETWLHTRAGSTELDQSLELNKSLEFNKSLELNNPALSEVRDDDSASGGRAGSRAGSRAGREAGRPTGVAASVRFLDALGQFTSRPYLIWVRHIQTDWRGLSELILLTVGFAGIPMVPWGSVRDGATASEAVSASALGLGLAASALAAGGLLLAQRWPGTIAYTAPRTSTVADTVVSGCCWHMLAAAIALLVVSADAGYSLAGLVRAQSMQGMWSAFLWPSAFTVWCLSCAPLVITSASAAGHRDAIPAALRRILFAYLTVYAFLGGWSLGGLFAFGGRWSVTDAMAAALCLQGKVAGVAVLLVIASRAFGRVPKDLRDELNHVWNRSWRLSLPLILLTVSANAGCRLLWPAASPLLLATIGWLLLTVFLGIAGRTISDQTLAAGR